MAGGEGALTGSIVGGHQVGQLIGVGSLAEVYETRHPALAQPMALKVFAPGIAEHATYVETMRDIAASAQRLRAAHILPIYDFAREGDYLYLSMPLMHESLRALLQRANRLPLTQAIALLRQMAAGLAPAHAAGIIHRDLKPENVLLDTHGHVFISDFGVGRELPPGGAQRNAPDTLSSLIGSPAYMAPEQLRGLPTDQRSDVYALGVILYEMLTGAPPFSGATIYEVAAQALTTPIPPLAQRGAGMTSLLERAILRSLARDPAGRWPTAQRFIVGLDAALPTQPDMSGEMGALNDLDAPDGVKNRDAGEVAPNPPTHPQMTIPLLPALDANAAEQSLDGPAIADEIGEAALAEHSLGGTSTGVMRDLRLFRVDPLPPQPARKQPTGLLLVGVVFLLLGALAAGGALLAHAAQTSQGNPVATPTSTPAALPPTQFIIDPMQTVQPIPSAQPTLPPAPRPTATPKPKPQPTATPAPQPTATPAPAPTATAMP